jgi:hypothetical protein
MPQPSRIGNMGEHRWCGIARGTALAHPSRALGAVVLARAAGDRRRGDLQHERPAWTCACSADGEAEVRRLRQRSCYRSLVDSFRAMR